MSLCHLVTCVTGHNRSQQLLYMERGILLGSYIVHTKGIPLSMTFYLSDLISHETKPSFFNNCFHYRKWSTLLMVVPYEVTPVKRMFTLLKDMGGLWIWTIIWTKFTVELVYFWQLPNLTAFLVVVSLLIIQVNRVPGFLQSSGWFLGHHRRANSTLKPHQLWGSSPVDGCICSDTVCKNT